MNAAIQPVAAVPFDLARAILLADEVAPSPAVAADALRAMRRALADAQGVSVRQLVGSAFAAHPRHLGATDESQSV